MTPHPTDDFDLATWSQEKVKCPAVYETVEHCSVRAARWIKAKYTFSAYASVKYDRTLEKMQEKSGKKTISEQKVNKQLALDLSLIKKLCGEIACAGGRIKRRYTFRDTTGRRFSDGGVQNAWGSLRTVLVNGREKDVQTYDYDMKNAHPTILLHVCQTNSIDCVCLKNLVENREHVMKAICTELRVSRSKCKDMILACINDERPVRSNCSLLNQLDTEFKQIQKKVASLKEYEWIAPHLEGLENYNGKFINHVMCHLENKLLQCAVVYFTEMGFHINTLMFDGLMLLIPSEDEIAVSKAPQSEHLRRLNDICVKVYGIDMRWDVKTQETLIKIPDDWETDALLPLFEEVVETFNKNHFKVGPNYLTMSSDLRFSIVNKRIFTETYDHIHVESPDGSPEGVKFIINWLCKYPALINQYYDEAREYPPGDTPRSICPPNHYNIWQPFAFEMWDETTNPDGSKFQYNDRHAEMIESVILGLCEDNKEYYKWFMQWLYTCLFHPATKSGRVPYFISEQGVGKDSFVSLLEEVFGAHRLITESNPSENIWGRFNSALQSSYFVILTEVGIKDIQEGLGRAKHLMTQYSHTLNIKNVAQIPNASTYHRFMGITNIGSRGEISPVPVGQDERRFILFRSSSRLIGNTTFWNEFHGAHEDKTTRWQFVRTFLEMIKKHEHGPLFSNEECPKTLFQQQAASRHPIEEYAISLSRAKRIDGVVKYTSDQLWEQYKEFAENSNISLGKMTNIQFGIKLSRFDIPGIPVAKNIKWASRVVKGRYIDHTALRQWADKIDPMITEERKLEIRTKLRHAIIVVRCCSILNRSFVKKKAEQPVMIKYREKKFERLDMRSMKQFEERKSVEASDRIKSFQCDDFKGAGVIFYNENGFYLGYEVKTKNKRTTEHWVDFGGKRTGLETPFQTASREALEECGIDISERVLSQQPVYHPESNSKYVFFFVHEKEPHFNHSASITKINRFTRLDIENLHPRLLYDKGGYINNRMRELKLLYHSELLDSESELSGNATEYNE
jgi:hypothetical protein